MRASLFITCYNDTLFPETGRAVVHLLERLGVTLDFHPGQTCCGQMHANTGFRAEAFSQAKRFVRLYQDAETVVIPSTSCVAMIRDQYPGLFAELGNEALRKEFTSLLPRVFELSEFLIDKLAVEDVGAYFPHRVTYHASCHGLRGLHVGDRPFRLLNKVRGLDLVPLEHLDRCCGFGGTFAVKYGELSTAIVAKKAARIAATGADTLIAGDLGCLMNMAGKLQRDGSAIKARHVAEVLAGFSDEPAIGEGAAK